MTLAAAYIDKQVAAALAEDIGTGDASAELIDSQRWARARLISRDPGLLAGQAWAESAFRQLDERCQLNWTVAEGESFVANTELAQIAGPAHALLTAERTALNFLQLLSGTATITQRYVQAVAGTGCRILDTRKTVPGLRLDQKYAVRVGGGCNHRIGLHDLVMLKENHLAASGGITEAVSAARERWPTLQIEVETETLEQVAEAVEAGAHRIMLDNFDLATTQQAVELAGGRAVLEASGGITLDTIRAVAETGVDEISVGELTKSVTPLDLSLRFEL